METLQVAKDGHLSPDDYVIISKDEFRELLAARDRVEASQSEDKHQWWVMKDLVSRYKCRPTWFTDNVFQNPRFESRLRGQIVMYPGDGVKGYHCEPNQFGKFLADWFPEIARAAKEGAKNHVDSKS